MNGPIKIYKIKPIVRHDFAVELPKCMYGIKNIHSTRNKVDGTGDHVSSPDKKLDIFDQNCQEVPGMAELEARQNEILDQLGELKKQIYSIKCDLKIQNNSIARDFPVSAQNAQYTSHRTSIPDSLVINANPTSPPFSLEVLQRLLQDNVGLAVTSYLHSSVVSLPESTNKLKDSLSNFKPKPGVPVVNVRIIWKSITSNTEFLISHTPVIGEVNLLRFFSRLTDSKISYDSDLNSVQVDSLLDQCYLLVRAKTKSEKTSILQIINKSLGKSQWLVGRNEVGIADVAAFSSIKQCLSPNELNVNVGKWYERCQTLVS